MESIANKQKAVFGGGCFWCTEAVFKMLKGVNVVLPGFSGGAAEDADYYKVASGQTGHAEVIYIEYDPSQVSYRDLLTVFFASHDPTTLNRQGNDIGPQYRSVVFYTNAEQKAEAEKFIKEINDSSKGGDPVVTDLAAFEKFYEAPEEHKDFYARNKNQPYCQIVINPKLAKVQKQFSKLLKKSE